MEISKNLINVQKPASFNTTDQGSKDKTINENSQGKTASEKIKEGVEKTKDHHFTKEEIDEQIENMNKFLELNSTSLKFQVHEKLDRISVQIVNKDTDEVIREVPPQELLDMVATMLEHVGLIIDQKI
ncbi:flagellar protein FlaG [Alkalihalobacterium alkalinitrilicum]|uniref:flagellar protein FlaG n=1 Tax=Alkalihalobacterium alkalinitrilicum TaxID=427920 RepID=UPI0013035415|nr:flagellar protein FlaG [Alkalihalobacterium alkalinitrilicum]